MPQMASSHSMDHQSWSGWCHRRIPRHTHRLLQVHGRPMPPHRQPTLELLMDFNSMIRGQDGIPLTLEDRMHRQANRCRDSHRGPWRLDLWIMSKDRQSGTDCAKAGRRSPEADHSYITAVAGNCLQTRRSRETVPVPPYGGGAVG